MEDTAALRDFDPVHVAETRSFGDVGSMSGLLPESGHWETPVGWPERANPVMATIRGTGFIEFAASIPSDFCEFNDLATVLHVVPDKFANRQLSWALAGLPLQQYGRQAVEPHPIAGEERIRLNVNALGATPQPFDGGCNILGAPNFESGDI